MHSSTGHLSSAMHLNPSGFRVMYRQHLCQSCRSRYQAVLIFSHQKKKKKGGKRCLKSLLLNSYKSALAVVLQHNLCKAMALLSQNRFAVVGWFSDEEQLSSIRHVFFFFLSDQSPPPHRTCPAPLEAFGNLCIERLKPLQALHDCII